MYLFMKIVGTILFFAPFVLLPTLACICSKNGKAMKHLWMLGASGLSFMFFLLINRHYGYTDSVDDVSFGLVIVASIVFIAISITGYVYDKYRKEPEKTVYDGPDICPLYDISDYEDDTNGTEQIKAIIALPNIKSINSGKLQNFYDLLFNNFGPDVANQVVFIKTLSETARNSNDCLVLNELSKVFVNKLENDGIKEAVCYEVIKFYGWDHLTTSTKIH